MDLPKRFGKNEIKIISEKIPYDGFFRVTEFRLQFRRFQGDWSPELSRELFDRGSACAVLLYDPKKDAVILCEQFRVGCIRDEESAWQYEIVAGMVENNELLEDTIKREALEEAGCKIEKIIPIATYYSSPGACSEKIHLFYAEVDSAHITGIHGAESEGENIRIHCLCRQKAYDLIEKGKINNATAILALQWLMLKIIKKEH